MVTLITLISDMDNPLLVSYDTIKEHKETKLQYSGLIRSTAEEDNGFRKTRVNKSRLNKVRTVSKEYLSITMEAWCLEADVKTIQEEMEEELLSIMSTQEKEVGHWQILTKQRMAMLTDDAQ